VTDFQSSVLVDDRVAEIIRVQIDVKTLCGHIYGLMTGNKSFLLQQVKYVSFSASVYLYLYADIARLSWW